MTAAFAATWVRLRHPPLLGGAALAALVFSGFVTVFSLTNADRPARGDDLLTLAEIEAADGLAALIGQPVMMVGAVIISTCAGIVAGDFQSGTLRHLLVASPDRLRLLAGTWAALMAFVVVLTSVASLGVTALAVGVAGPADVDASAWWSQDGVVEAVAAEARMAVCLAGFGTGGVVLALVLKSAGPAIGAALVIGLFDGLLGGAVGGVFHYLPLQLLGAVATAGNENVSFVAALGLSGAWVGAAGMMVAWRFRSEDIVA